MRETPLPVRIGLGTLGRPMTRAQARRYGDRAMPGDLRRAGFKTAVATTDPDLHGGAWHRISYGK